MFRAIPKTVFHHLGESNVPVIGGIVNNDLRKREREDSREDVMLLSHIEHSSKSAVWKNGSSKYNMLSANTSVDYPIIDDTAMPAMSPVSFNSPNFRRYRTNEPNPAMLTPEPGNWVRVPKMSADFTTPPKMVLSDDPWKPIDDNELNFEHVQSSQDKAPSFNSVKPGGLGELLHPGSFVQPTRYHAGGLNQLKKRVRMPYPNGINLKDSLLNIGPNGKHTTGSQFTTHKTQTKWKQKSVASSVPSSILSQQALKRLQGGLVGSKHPLSPRQISRVIQDEGKSKHMRL